MKEHYVSYEQSVKLKELGFDWKCDHYYTYGYENLDSENTNKIVRFHTDIIPNIPRTISVYGLCYSAPRLDQAAAWLREVKNVIVCPFPERYKEYVVQGIYSERLSGWDYEIWVDEEEYSEPKFGYIESYEKALEIGVDKALELLGKEVNNA